MKLSCRSILVIVWLSRVKQSSDAEPQSKDLKYSDPGSLLLVQVEVVNAFEGKDGLKAFRDWVLTPDKDILEEAQRVGKKGKGKKKGEPQDPPGLPPLPQQVIPYSR